MKRPFLWSGIIGIAVIVVGLAINIISPGPSSNLREGFKTPVIAFEFATEGEHVELIFDKASPQEEETFVRAMTNGTRLDFLFLILYGAFLVSFSIICISQTGNRLYYWAAILAIIAPVFDILENLQMLTIIEQFLSGETYYNLQTLQFYTWAKWGALALAFLFLAPFFSSAGKFGRYLSFFAFVPFVLGILAFIKPGLLNELFAQSVVFMFVLMITFSFIYRISDESPSPPGLKTN
jgi:hypothetical protein